ncbi:MAG: glycosyltransferase family 8 protein [Ruminococcaceae bacterium]|nr:glycosyltransferase family 8 protein [Oscillospiraceae bacterium]
MTGNNTRTIPVFYTTDDAYAPLLAVSITSLLANANKADFYNIHIIASNMNQENREKIASLASDNASIEFNDISGRVSSIAHRFAIRDYYSISTYMRIFIARAFPQYEKALYIDSDTVINRNIAEMFSVDIGENLVGAVQENVMLLPIFGKYSETVLKVPRKTYFNAGLLVMNMKKMREIDLEARFIKLLGERSFPVAQDQDYLNVLCQGSVHYFDYSWNLMPAENMKGIEPYIVHYKMAQRPWNYDGIEHGDLFWKYAENSGFYDILKGIKASRTEEDAKRDQTIYENLERLALDEIARVENGDLK